MPRLEDRVAVITGAGRGIGAATARLFAREGASVVLNDVDKDPLEEVAGAIRTDGGKALVNTDNTVNPESAQNLINQSIEEFGKVDILINNAGITRDKMFHNLDVDMWDFVLDVNLRTSFNCSKAAVRHMREAAKKEMGAGGRAAYHRKINFTSSTAALMGNAGQVNYTAAKMAAVGMTRTLAAELGQFRINVNAVAPGFIETRLTKSKEQSEDPELGIPEAMRQMAVMLIPLGYYGEPEDVANAHLFLASSESDYVNGHTLVVGGGIYRG